VCMVVFIQQLCNELTNEMKEDVSKLKKRADDLEVVRESRGRIC